MKKILFVILALTLILALSGCKKTDNTSSESELSSEQIINITEESKSVIEEVSSVNNNASDDELQPEVNFENENSSKITNQNDVTNSKTENNSTVSSSSNNEEIESSVNKNQNQSQNNSNNDRTLSGWSQNPETGEIFYEYTDSQGNVYNENGDLLYNLNEWGTFIPN